MNGLANGMGGRSCKGKFQHPTERSAEEHRQRLIAAGASEDAYETYPCRRGPHWHVGHVPNRKRAAR